MRDAGLVLIGICIGYSLAILVWGTLMISSFKAEKPKELENEHGK